MRKARVILLRDLLPGYGIGSIDAFRQRLGLTKQYAWMLWHGKIALSVKMIRRLYGELAIPLEILIQVGRATPARPSGRPTKRSQLPHLYKPQSRKV